MDYTPINLAPKGVKQGDYFTTTIGPYDYWAIEYAYKPLSGGTEGELDELQKIASAVPTPGHDYATDEDMSTRPTRSSTHGTWAPTRCKFAQDRIVLAEELLKGLADRVVDKGEGYQRARRRSAPCCRQYGNGAYLVGKFVGGECTHRDHAATPTPAIRSCR